MIPKVLLMLWSSFSDSVLELAEGAFSSVLPSLFLGQITDTVTVTDVNVFLYISIFILNRLSHFLHHFVLNVPHPFLPLPERNK